MKNKKFPYKILHVRMWDFILQRILLYEENRLFF